MTSAEIFNRLHMLFTKCRDTGMVKITQSENKDSMILTAPGGGIMGREAYRHFLEFIPMNVKSVCWITPKLSAKNTTIMEKILKEYQDKSYIIAEPCGNGCKYKLKCFNARGKCIHKKTIKLFSINMGSSVVIDKNGHKQTIELSTKKIAEDLMTKIMNSIK